MKVEIEISNETAAQLRQVMRKTEYPENELAEFCVFLLRNALSQILTLLQMRENVDLPPKNETPKIGLKL